MAKSRKRGFIFGDLHFPWVHEKALKIALDNLKAFKPDYVVQIGDLYDYYSASRFPRSHNVTTPEQEVSEGREWAEWFWAKVNKFTKPSCKLYQIRGNHCIRPLRRVLERAPELEQFVAAGLNPLFQFKGVRTVLDPTEELYIDDITYMHGYMCQPGAHMMQSHENIIRGHSHRGGTVFHPWNSEIKFELDVGFLADINAPPLRYRPRKKFFKCTLGHGIVEPNLVSFVPIQV